MPDLSDSFEGSFFHKWDVRCKIITILCFCFMVASISNFAVALIAISFALLVIVMAQVSLQRVLRRLLAISGFMLMFLLIMPFSVPVLPGDTIIVPNGIQWMGFNMRGLYLAATVASKAVAITMMMEPLFSTAPLPVTLHGLSRLGVPEMVAQMILLSHRYLHVFRHEASRISSGMKVRGFRKRSDLATLQAVANFTGMLFVRSFDRTERVFDAMKARGYKGCFPEPLVLKIYPLDIFISGIGVAMGVLLIAVDKNFFI
ncbi:conserved membrane hypothetical protein [Desulfamplus magnetovallimortis]|uniref:Cobalt ECF transporter T component CbiQ n=1 Tax=Desulfamplus magnetovallimortis TaxID=1246637 RepID=A0A1W1HBE7_9BACT|nr:cobalt ECF transporter T component CbiQ [Desulfamplus magnetovallimortis]SLM29759.1 conserved membrane hypothetical protein [Desulfamplus magnetovallimortis]